MGDRVNHLLKNKVGTGKYVKDFDFFFCHIRRFGSLSLPSRAFHFFFGGGKI